jgi:pimeloyl-ACP methyl ester carboxylesterase
MTRLFCSFALLFTASVGFLHAVEKPVMQSFDANGVKIWYFVEGKGEPVVLIHGWLSSAGINWALPGTSALLAKDHQVIALDMRGHGLSDKPTNEDLYGPKLVQDIVRLMDHLQIKKAHVIGYSMGGIVAANFIAKHQDRVLSGVLGGMGWMQPGGVAQRCFAQIGKNDPNAQAMTVCGRSLAKLAVTEEELQSIHVPMELVVGDKDGIIRALYVAPLRKARPDWPVVWVRGGDHLTCILKPQFRDALAAWLKKNPR